MIIENTSIIKPVITGGININPNSSSKAFLIFYPNLGYSLLSQYNKSIVLNSVASKKTIIELEQIRANINKKPSKQLKKNLKQCKELEFMYNVLDKYIFQAYKFNNNKPNIKSEYLNTWEILGLLIGDLEDKILYNEKEQKINEIRPLLRKYLLNNEYFYNTCNDFKHIVSNEKEAIKYANNQLEEVQAQINNLKNNLNKLYGVCNAYNITVKNKTKVNLNEEIANGLNINPVINLKSNSKKNNITNLANFIVKEFDIKTVNENEKLIKYYYNAVNGYYDCLSIAKTQQLIKANYGVTLLIDDVRKAFNSIAGNDIKQDTIFLFKNGVADIYKED